MPGGCPYNENRHVHRCTCLGICSCLHSTRCIWVVAWNRGQAVFLWSPPALSRWQCWGQRLGSWSLGVLLPWRSPLLCGQFHGNACRVLPLCLSNLQCTPGGERRPDSSNAAPAPRCYDGRLSRRSATRSH